MTDSSKIALNYQQPVVRPLIGTHVTRMFIYCMCALWVSTVFLLSVFMLPTFVFAVSICSIPIWTLLVILILLTICVWRKTFSPYWIRPFVVMIGSPVLVLSIALWGWPMTMAWATSSSALNRIADQAAAGAAPATPVRAGFFTIRRIEIRQGAVCLWIYPNPAGPHGFVRCVAGKGPPCNIWSDTVLWKQWHYVEED